MRRPAQHSAKVEPRRCSAPTCSCQSSRSSGLFSTDVAAADTAAYAAHEGPALAALAAAIAPAQPSTLLQDACVGGSNYSDGGCAMGSGSASSDSEEEAVEDEMPASMAAAALNPKLDIRPDSATTRLAAQARALISRALRAASKGLAPAQVCLPSGVSNTANRHGMKIGRSLSFSLPAGCLRGGHVEVHTWARQVVLLTVTARHVLISLCPAGGSRLLQAGRMATAGWWQQQRSAAEPGQLRCPVRGSHGGSTAGSVSSTLSAHCCGVSSDGSAGDVALGAKPGLPVSVQRNWDGALPAARRCARCAFGTGFVPKSERESLQV